MCFEFGASHKRRTPLSHDRMEGIDVIMEMQYEIKQQNSWDISSPVSHNCSSHIIHSLLGLKTLVSRVAVDVAKGDRTHRVVEGQASFHTFINVRISQHRAIHPHSCIFKCCSLDCRWDGVKTGGGRIRREGNPAPGSASGSGRDQPRRRGVLGTLELLGKACLP